MRSSGNADKSVNVRWQNGAGGFNSPLVSVKDLRLTALHSITFECVMASVESAAVVHTAAFEPDAFSRVYKDVAETLKMIGRTRLLH